MLRALWNIFNAFAEPREELLEAAADQAAQGKSASSPIANGAYTIHIPASPRCKVHEQRFKELESLLW